MASSSVCRGRGGAYPGPGPVNQSRRRLVRALTAVIALDLMRRMAGRIERVEVAGESMRPALLPGDRLLVLRDGPVRPGWVVALTDPRRPDRVMVKRVGTVLPGSITVYGDNASDSTDSRHFGPVGRTAIHGPAFYRYGPPSRVGVVKGPSHATRW